MKKHEILQTLKRIRNDATMKDASFRIGEQPFPFGAECTDIVRTATKLWCDSWIIGPLDEIIAAMEQNQDESR